MKLAKETIIFFVVNARHRGRDQSTGLRYYTAVIRVKYYRVGRHCVFDSI